MELSACCTAAVSRRSQSSPRTRRPSVVEGSGIARISIAAAAMFWLARLKIGGCSLASSLLTTALLLLLESVSELLQQESILVDFCLELTELL